MADHCLSPTDSIRKLATTLELGDPNTQGKSVFALLEAGMLDAYHNILLPSLRPWSAHHPVGVSGIPNLP